MTKFLCGECIHNSDKGGGCLIPKNLGYVDNCNRYLPKDKPIVQTNEEYLKSCDTEQLAEWFINSGFLTCTLRDCEDCKYYDKNNDDCIDGSEAINDKQMWVEWLKQPHTNE